MHLLICHNNCVFIIVAIQYLNTRVIICNFMFTTNLFTICIFTLDYRLK